MLSPDEVEDLARQVPAFADSLHAGEAEPTPEWFTIELDRARQRRLA